MLKDQVDRGYFDFSLAEAEQETVLFWHAIEAPRKVRYVLRELTYLLHPLAAPRSRIKERHQPKRLRSSNIECAANLGAGNHLRLGAVVRIKKVVDPV